MSFLYDISGDCAFKSFQVSSFSLNSLDFNKLSIFPIQENSFLSLVKQATNDLIYAFNRQDHYTPLFYHPLLLRETLLQNIETPLQVNEVMSLNYLQLETLEQLQNKSEDEILAFSGVQENISIQHTEWIVLEIVYNETTESLYFARFCGNDGCMSVYQGNKELVSKLQTMLLTANQLYQANNLSLVAKEDQKQEKEYIEKWWEKRNEVENQFRTFLHNVDSSFLSWIQFLFLPWNYSIERKQCVDQIMPYFENHPSIQSFLYCNEQPLSPSFLQQLFQLLSLPIPSQPWDIQLLSFLQQYNQTILSKPSNAPIILCCSPELQNFPFESIPSLTSFSILRNLCLECISKQEAILSSQLLLSPGSFVLDISFFIFSKVGVSLTNSLKEIFRKHMNDYNHY